MIILEYSFVYFFIKGKKSFHHPMEVQDENECMKNLPFED